MASNSITRDHHNLRRNLRLNGNYISNDGGDEGISIQDDGDVAVSGKLYLDSQGEYLESDGTDLTIASAGSTVLTNAQTTSNQYHTTIDKNFSYSQTDTSIGLEIDYDDTASTSISHTATNKALLINLSSASPTKFGGCQNYGIDLDVAGGTSGSQTNYGMDISVTGADSNYGIKILSSHRQLYLDYDGAGNSCSFIVSDGEVKMATGAAGAMNILLDSSGDITLDAAGGDVTVLQADLTIPVDKKVIFGDAGEYIVGDGTNLEITSSGHATLNTVGNITLDAEGDIQLNANGANITLADGLDTYTPTAASDATTKAYVDSVMYDHRVCNYYSVSTLIQYVPLAGYILEGALLNSNEFRAMVMPYDGSLIRVIWRSETEQTSGTFGIQMLISDDGTELPTTTNFLTRVVSFTLAANTTYVHDPGVTAAYHATGNESNAFSKGQIIAVGIDPTVAPYDTNCTLVFKYDTST